MTSNLVIILGNVGRDPETKDGVTSLSVCTSHKDRDENEITLWHRVVSFAKTAEIVQKNIKKGDTVLLEGKLNYFKTEDRGVITSIIAHKVIRAHRPREVVTETKAA